MKKIIKKDIKKDNKKDIKKDLKIDLKKEQIMQLMSYIKYKTQEIRKE